MKYIITGLPTLIFSLLSAMYFSVYGSLKIADSEEVVVGNLKQVLFKSVPEMLTSSIYTITSVVLLGTLILATLTVEAYKLGSKFEHSEENLTIYGASVELVQSVLVIMMGLLVGVFLYSTFYLT